MPSYDNPVPYLNVTKKSVKYMVLLSSIGMGIIIFLTIGIFSYTIIPTMITGVFYIFSIWYIMHFHNSIKEKVPENIHLTNKYFYWKEDEKETKVKYSKVTEIERVNDSLYVVHYHDNEIKKEVFLYWPIAEEIEERAGLYPWGSKDIMEKTKKKE